MRGSESFVRMDDGDRCEEGVHGTTLFFRVLCAFRSGPQLAGHVEGHSDLLISVLLQK